MSPVLGDGSQPCGATLAPVSEGTWGISAGMGGGGGCFPPEHLLRWYRRLLHPGAAMLRAHICQMPFLSPGVTQAPCPPVLGGPHTSPFPLTSFPEHLKPFPSSFLPAPHRVLCSLWVFWEGLLDYFISRGWVLCPPVGTHGCCCDAGGEVSPARLQPCELVGCCSAKLGWGRIQALLCPWDSAPWLAGGSPWAQRPLQQEGWGVLAPLCSCLHHPPCAPYPEENICLEKI